ncbi:hypothetical protein OSB04_028520 [Centaurea solstitialis]|uniref:non-specific serine/threonine protein kinase n=1 Tax=Centaurea solstitialis TaxID=347529 RepID=A0AA38W9C2_9ASTR|nr:hypothetical protein OSB04_028520 [Centaurea solstitialis]
MGNCFQKPVNNLSSTNNAPNQAVGNNEERNEPMIENCPAMISETVTPNLKKFTFADLKKATGNFRPTTVVGEGDFGMVFRGWVDGETYAPSKVGVGIAIAIKKSIPNRVHGLKEWQAKVNLLDKFNHPNLVKLLGYCWEDKEFLLVYEYMEKGSLENHLFRIGKKVLPWDTRIKIAIEAAQGLVFLHATGMITIYKDIISSDILLDKDFNAKLSGFGQANLRPANDDDSCVPTGIVVSYDFGQANLGPANGYPSTIIETYHYAAPEYITTDPLYVKNNVYSFGVVLLEMITGLPVLDIDRASLQHNLVERARPALTDKTRLQEIIDPRLETNYPSKGATEASKLILHCVEQDPKNRPSMEEVLTSLKYISTIKTKS